MSNINRLLVVLWLCAFQVTAEPVKLQSNSADTALEPTIIKIVLDRLGMPYTFPYDNQQDVSRTRIENDIKIGELDVMWVMSSKQLEDDYEAIYFPVYRGILGMRVGVIKNDRPQLLSGVRSLTDLQRFTAGQGKTWTDTFILEANNIKVAKSLKYPNLFFMLEGERFDYFPRGLFEPWSEIERFAELNLTVDKHVLIKYTAPMYFFTRKGNTQLANKIFRELESMSASGEYQQLFFADQKVNEGLTKSNVQDRVIIELDNPYLTDRTPLQRKEFWYQPGEGVN